MTKLAVVGATGLVGTKILETLDRKGIAFDELVLFLQHVQQSRSHVSRSDVYRARIDR